MWNLEAWSFSRYLEDPMGLIFIVCVITITFLLYKYSPRRKRKIDEIK